MYCSREHLKFLKNPKVGLMMGTAKNRQVAITPGKCTAVENLEIPPEWQVVHLKDCRRVKVFQKKFKAFPDIKVVINELIEENDKVVFRGHFTATHSGEFVGIAASAVKVEFEALEIFKI